MALVRPWASSKDLNGQLSWFILWVAITAVGAFLTPDRHGHGTHQQLGLPPCPTVLIFDRPCPGCGLTTSWTALIHGDLATSFHAHPLGPALYLILTVLAWASLWARLRKLRLNTDGAEATRALYVGLAIFVGFGLIRMAMSPHYATSHERWLRAVTRS